MLSTVLDNALCATLRLLQRSTLFSQRSRDIGDRLFSLVQEGRRDKAGGRREERLYSKLFNLFGLVGYFRRAALVMMLP